MNNSKYFLAILVLILMSLVYFCSFFIIPSTIPASMFNKIAYAKEELNDETTAQAMIVLEANSGRILAGYNIDQRLPMASTTKIMTCLVALENCEELDIIVPIATEAVGIEGTSIYLREFDELTMRELLYGLMLSSGNDASVAIAHYIGEGNINTFIDKMNEKANELGLINTHFDNTHGLDSDTHYTSAYDLAIITKEALKNNDFKQICSTKIKQINGNSEVGNRFLRNKQKLLYSFDGCIGVKTGFTDRAGRCNVVAVEQDNMQLISVVLNCPDMFIESEKLITTALNNYKMIKLLPEYHYVEAINVIDGEVDSIKTYTRAGFSYPIKDNELSRIKVEKELLQNVKAPIEKDKIIGELKILLDNELIFSEKIYTIDNVESTLLSNKIKNVLEKWYN